MRVYSQEEFDCLRANSKGLLFVLLNDLILDVTAWADKHPGGRFLIEKTKGTDISRYFYGGYSFETSKQGGSQHAHSNYARTIVEDLVIGKLKATREPATAYMKVEHKRGEAERIKTLTLAPIDELQPALLTGEGQSVAMDTGNLGESNREFF